MTAAGIDTSTFKPHSTRSAATSAAKVADVPLDEIMATAGWRSSSVFAVFYNKPLSSDKSFATTSCKNGETLPLKNTFSTFPFAPNLEFNHFPPSPSLPPFNVDR